MDNDNNKENTTESEQDKTLNKILTIIIAFILLAGFINTLIRKPNAKYKISENAPEGTQKIPETVLEATTPTDNLANILSSEKKVLYFAYPDFCPISKNFKNNLETSLKQAGDDFSQNYYYYPDPQGRSTLVYCKQQTTDCIQNYLLQNCREEVWVINPVKKEIYKLPRKPLTIYDTVKQYKDW